MAATLQSILLRHFPRFSAENRLPLQVHRAVRAIIDCRTEAMGGHVLSCPAGHVKRVQYNSCKHRSCPQCSSLPIERWLTAQRSCLLATDHFHVVFTLPHDLHPWWRWNRKLFTEILFRAVRDTLFELLEDEKYLTARPGVIATLHTWGRTLSLHPHIHCLVTGGGMDRDGRWRPVRNGYLLPIHVVRKLFRGKFLGMLMEAVRSGKLAFPDDAGEAALRRVIQAWYRRPWNVCLRERYSHGSGVMTYLARYVRGGPISNRRIISADDSLVRFRYKDHSDGRSKILTLPSREFLTRILQHVPDRGLHVVRYFGLYHPHARLQLNAIRTQLGQASVEKQSLITWQTYLERIDAGHQERCPVCGRLIISVGTFRRGKAPPGDFHGQRAA
jgi:hypothetical protein